MTQNLCNPVPTGRKAIAISPEEYIRWSKFENAVTTPWEPMAERPYEDMPQTMLHPACQSFEEKLGPLGRWVGNRLADMDGMPPSKKQLLSLAQSNRMEDAIIPLIGACKQASAAYDAGERWRVRNESCNFEQWLRAIAPMSMGEIIRHRKAAFIYNHSSVQVALSCLLRDMEDELDRVRYSRVRRRGIIYIGLRRILQAIGL